MNADVYAAWLTAGNRLQPVVGWVGAHWWLIPTLAAVAFAAWAIRPCLRDASRKVDDIFADRPEAPQPGSDQQLLDACNNAYYGPNHQHRKETP